jgi:hypothetical protein
MALFCFVLFIAWLSFGEVHAYSSFPNPEQVRFGCLVSSSGCAQMGDTIINREWYTKVVVDEMGCWQLWLVLCVCVFFFFFGPGGVCVCVCVWMCLHLSPFSYIIYV